MKTHLIAPFAVVLFFLAACGQKSAQITSSSPVASPSSTRPEAVEPDDSRATTASGAEAPSQDETAPSPAQSAASDARPQFNSEAATQAANQYLDSYAGLINDLNAPAQPPTGSPEATMSYLSSYTQKIARESAEVANRQRQAESQLTPEERRRLRQYRKSLEQQGQE